MRTKYLAFSGGLNLANDKVQIVYHIFKAIAFIAGGRKLVLELSLDKFCWVDCKNSMGKDSILRNCSSNLLIGEIIKMIAV